MKAFMRLSLSTRTHRSSYTAIQNKEVQQTLSNQTLAAGVFAEFTEQKSPFGKYDWKNDSRIGNGIDG